jgi:peptide/nickel transport system ATP-binding protein
VLYLGYLLATSTSQEVSALPWQPYTEMLLQSVPEPDPDRPFPAMGQTALARDADEGESGCPFAPRCLRKVGPICDRELPPCHERTATNSIRCHSSAAELATSQQPLA